MGEVKPDMKGKHGLVWLVLALHVLVASIYVVGSIGFQLDLTKSDRQTLQDSPDEDGIAQIARLLPANASSLFLTNQSGSDFDYKLSYRIYPRKLYFYKTKVPGTSYFQRQNQGRPPQAWLDSNGIGWVVLFCGYDSQKNLIASLSPIGTQEGAFDCSTSFP